MIGNFWNNIGNGTQILIASGDTLAHLQVIDLQTVYNRGELVGLAIDLLTKVASPGSGKKVTVFYAFSTKGNRTAAELYYAAASQDLTLDSGGAGTSRGYTLPINYQAGRYLYFWFTADAFTDPTAQLEADITALAKTMN